MGHLKNNYFMGDFLSMSRSKERESEREREGNKFAIKIKFQTLYGKNIINKIK